MYSDRSNIMREIDTLENFKRNELCYYYCYYYYYYFKQSKICQNNRQLLLSIDGKLSKCSVPRYGVQGISLQECLLKETSSKSIEVPELVPSIIIYQQNTLSGSPSRNNRFNI